MPALPLQGNVETGYKSSTGAMMNIIFALVLEGSLEILVIWEIHNEIVLEFRALRIFVKVQQQIQCSWS